VSHQERGTYRAVFSMLFDDPDYQRLPVRVRLLLLTTRLCKDAGPAAIFRYYPETLAHQTGTTPNQVNQDLKVLADGGWIVYDNDVLWVRNGLRYDPTITLANPNHLAAVRRSISRLPKSPVVLKFCDYYEIEYPSGWHLDGIEIPYPIREKGEGNREKGEGNREKGEGNRETETEVAEAHEAVCAEAHVGEQQQKTKRRTRKPPLTDVEWLAALRALPVYAGLDLDHELGKMDAWLLANPDRDKTRPFITGWLNRAVKNRHVVTTPTTSQAPPAPAMSKAERYGYLDWDRIEAEKAAGLAPRRYVGKQS
jgi:hypothetical protein